MGQTEPTRQSDNILPAIVGSIYAIAVTSTVAIIDLASLAQSAAVLSTTGKGTENLNPVGQFLTFVADGGPVYYACAKTFAALSAVTIATTSAVNGTTGAVTASPNAMQLLPAGQPVPMRIPNGNSTNMNATGTSPVVVNGIAVGAQAPHGALSEARFLAVACPTGVTSTLRINVSSP
jgi:hypothetical protein